MQNHFKLILFFLVVLSYAQKKEDLKAIKSMCGCYEVQFFFTETFNYSKDSENYIPSVNKIETALEWIELIEDSPKKISLQHLLITKKNIIIKHWRQDWVYENTRFYDFNGFNNWKYFTKTSKEVKKQWTQSVYEVDDRPRYTGSSFWVHIDRRNYWKNTTNAPLPRREYTKRNDYNIIRRTNVHEIVENGWIHNQDNDKIIRNEQGNDYLLAQEKGYNFYKKIADFNCILAKKWWKANKYFWKKVRLKWEIEFLKNKDLKIKNEVNGNPLYDYLYNLERNATQEEINIIIDQFIFPQ